MTVNITAKENLKAQVAAANVDQLGTEKVDGGLKKKSQSQINDLKGNLKESSTLADSAATIEAARQNDTAKVAYVDFDVDAPKQKDGFKKMAQSFQDNSEFQLNLYDKHSQTFNKIPTTDDLMLNMIKSTTAEAKGFWQDETSYWKGLNAKQLPEASKPQLKGLFLDLATKEMEMTSYFDVEKENVKGFFSDKNKRLEIGGQIDALKAQIAALSGED